MVIKYLMPNPKEDPSSGEIYSVYRMITVVSLNALLEIGPWFSFGKIFG
jgi:hypothetical protein